MLIIEPLFFYCVILIILHQIKVTHAQKQIILFTLCAWYFSLILHSYPKIKSYNEWIRFHKYVDSLFHGQNGYTINLKYLRVSFYELYQIFTSLIFFQKKYLKKLGILACWMYRILILALERDARKWI